MTARIARLLMVAILATFASGVPQVLAAALDDCCTEPCAGTLDGKRCPPNCDQGVCAKVHASIAPAAAPSHAPVREIVRSVVVAEGSPRLPMVIASVFHPPIA